MQSLALPSSIPCMWAVHSPLCYVRLSALENAPCSSPSCWFIQLSPLPFSKLSQESHIPSLFICEFLSTGAFWQNLRKYWLKRRKRGKGLVFKVIFFLPNIEGNLFKIKQTCYKITYTVKCTCTHNVIISTFFLSEKTTGKSAPPARSDFTETAEFTPCWIMLLRQWFSIVIYFDWHQKPSRTGNCKDTRKKSLTKWLDSSC